MTDYQVWYDLNNERWTSRPVHEVDQTRGHDHIESSETPPQLTPAQRAELRRVLDRTDDDA